MSKDTVLNQLWNAPVEQGVPFHLGQVAELPSAVRRYLEHTVAPGMPKMSAVWLQMRGMIRLRANWYPFDADQVIHWDRGFIWRARVRMKGMPVTGFDRWIDGEGAVRWRLLGIIPIITASGLDVSRSAMERMQIEAIWLPSVLLGPGVAWSEQDATHVGVDVMLRGQHTHLKLSIDMQGHVRSISMLRWGNPEGYGYSALPFGGIVEGERTFGGFTIPSRLRVGWYFGTDRFESEGEFFRCTLNEAVYR